MTEQQQWTWQPIRKQVRLGTDEPTGNYLMLVDGDLVEYDYYGDELARYPLRDDTAFCRRVPAQAGELAQLQIAVVALHEIENLGAEYPTNNNTDAMFRIAHQALCQLDAQSSQPGQEVGDV
jgi:hypothetical protein